MKKNSNEIKSGLEAEKSEGVGAVYNEEFLNEPLTAEQRQNNKKRKKNQ